MKETILEIPDGCEVDKIETQEGHIVVTFREKERKLPKSLEEFCEMFPIKENQECFIFEGNVTTICGIEKRRENMREILPDRTTAEAVLALCQLIQLRNCYNGDWVPDYKTAETKWTIEFEGYNIVKNTTKGWPCILTFKTEELRDEFLHNFCPLIEKLKPLYGIKEGGEE